MHTPMCWSYCYFSAGELIPSCLSPPELCCNTTSLPRDTTPDKETVQLQQRLERGGSFSRSWGDASWNLCSASQETFSACVKDGSSWEAYRIWFAEKVVVQPESVCGAAGGLINNSNPCKVEYVKWKATGIKFSYRNRICELFQYEKKARSFC